MSRAEATKARILEAATAEFAAHGIAGARVDRIAAAARANKNLIYVYFGSKDLLFDAVFGAHVAAGLDRVPFTPGDLPGYAVRLFDHFREHPEVLRLATWHRLERGEDGGREPAGAEGAYKAKLDALDTAGTPFQPAEVLTLVLAIASAWSPVSPAAVPYAAIAGRDVDACRAAVAEAVRRLVG